MKQPSVTVIIPIYREQPSPLEVLSLDQTLAVLGHYPIAFMAPEYLDATWYQEHCRGKAAVRIERFDWEGYEDYVNLMMDPEYYRRFQAYEYLFMCQLDAFAFRDELPYWCGLGYDFVGAVIYNETWKASTNWWRRLTGFETPAYYANSGFCLKKVDTFVSMTSRFRHYISFYRWVSQLRGVQGFYDDLFISQHFPRLSSRFRMPSKAVAQRFGADYMEYDPGRLPFHNGNNENLPFGVHGWIQRQLDFWRPCINRCAPGSLAWE
ncbi:MAG TPA: DUF5672 family protein [Hymenobacter sp.]|jgi:hypothetical protein|uniref:DUF5672 family protein n=1 Tax=Hymenobacter sp. TaxID=1898978 RepID=UPI002ED77403